jgi:ATP-binding cassette subfamily C (CFTR/MRP) protein 1
MRSLGLRALSPVLPRLCLTAFTFSQPFLTSAMITYLGDSQNASDNTGYGLIGASFLVYSGMAVSVSLA